MDLVLANISDFQKACHDGNLPEVERIAKLCNFHPTLIIAGSEMDRDAYDLACWDNHPGCADVKKYLLKHFRGAIEYVAEEC